MKPGALLDRLTDLVYGPFSRRQVFAVGAAQGLTQCARIVAILAPADAVENYVHTLMKGERQLERWRFAYIAGGGLMPGVFAVAGYYASFANPWWIVAAQLAWIAIWTLVGTPWLFAMVDEQLLELRALALTELCQTVPEPTQAKLDAATRKLGLPGQWTARQHDDDNAKP